MALEREARTNFMGSEIDKRNRNWGKVDDHMLEIAEDDVHGLASMINTALLRTSQSGYFRDTKTGLMLQWGDVGIPAGRGYATVTYPVVFSNAAMEVYAFSKYLSGDVDSMATFMTVQIREGADVEKTCTVYARDKNGNIPTVYKQADWFAIGY